MERTTLLAWVDAGLTRLRDDVYLFENDLNERCISARLGGYLQQLLPRLYPKDGALAVAKRHQVDCEYNRLGPNPKWIPWRFEIQSRTEHEPFYTPIPDIILHRRGPRGPNELVIEIKKEHGVNEFTALVDRLKLIGCVGPTLNYGYGLYLCLGVSAGQLKIVAAELIERALVNRALDGGQLGAWHAAKKLVERRIGENGRTYFFQSPKASIRTEAAELSSRLQRDFAFADVTKDLTLKAA